MCTLIDKFDEHDGKQIIILRWFQRSISHLVFQCIEMTWLIVTNVFGVSVPKVPLEELISTSSSLCLFPEEMTTRSRSLHSHSHTLEY